MTHTNEREQDTEKLVGQLVGIGRAWATHGLLIGKSALETSAATLRTTADVLGEISARVAKAKADEPTTEAPKTETKKTETKKAETKKADAT